MNTCIDCIPCIFRQALDGARRISDDPALHERVLREVAGWIQAADLAEPPPVMAWRLHRLLVQLTGIENPYAEAKHRDNALALALLIDQKLNTVVVPSHISEMFTWLYDGTGPGSTPVDDLI